MTLHLSSVRPVVLRTEWKGKETSGLIGVERESVVRRERRIKEVPCISRVEVGGGGG